MVTEPKYHIASHTSTLDGKPLIHSYSSNGLAAVRVVLEPFILPVLERQVYLSKLIPAKCFLPEEQFFQVHGILPASVILLILLYMCNCLQGIALSARLSIVVRAPSHHQSISLVTSLDLQVAKEV